MAAEKSLVCPRCKLISPPIAARCDCGYDFETKTVKTSYLSSCTAFGVTDDSNRPRARAPSRAGPGYPEIGSGKAPRVGRCPPAAEV